MIHRALTLLLVGAGFAGGMTVAMSCNLGRVSSVHDVYAQGQGEKKEAKEQGEEDDETPIKLADAPAPVRTAILKLTPESAIKKVIREGDEHMVVFEVEYIANGVACSADLSDQGAVMSLETAINTTELPSAAMNALTKRFPNGNIKSIASVQQFLYEADIEVNGKTREVKVNAAGKMPQHKD